jgi:hypothetical protein
MLIHRSGFSVLEPPSLLCAGCKGRGKSRSKGLWISTDDGGGGESSSHGVSQGSGRVRAVMMQG